MCSQAIPHEESPLTRAHAERLHAEGARQFNAGRYDEALECYRLVLAEAGDYWNAWYMAGQCHRMLEEFGSAVDCLRKAQSLKPQESAVLLALGIALQLNDELIEAKDIFGTAITIDRDFSNAYNSLALTQRKLGEYDKALYNYDAGIKATCRRFARTLANDAQNPITPPAPLPPGEWLTYTTFTGLWLAAEAGAAGVGWPTADTANHITRTGEHGGRYWIDKPNTDGGFTRLYLPVFLDTIAHCFLSDPEYGNLLRNRALVLEYMDRDDEAKAMLEEAAFFSRHAGPPPQGVLLEKAGP